MIEPFFPPDASRSFQPAALRIMQASPPSLLPLGILCWDTLVAGGFVTYALCLSTTPATLVLAFGLLMTCRRAACGF